MFRLAPGLALRLDGLPTSVERAVRRFLAHFPEFDGGGGAIVSLCGLPVPEANAAWEEVAATPSLRLQRRGSVLRLDSSAGSAWVEQERAGITPLPGLERDAAGLLLPSLLLELARRVDLVGLHAAGVAVDGRAALLPGPSGSGKSTLFREAGRLGLQMLSDDLIWLRETDDGSLRLHPFPRGEPSETAPRPTVWEAEPVLIAFPEIVSQPGYRSFSMDFQEALQAFLDQSSISGHPSGRVGTFRRIVRATCSLPVFRLEVGPDPSRGVKHLRELLSGRVPT